MDIIKPRTLSGRLILSGEVREGSTIVIDADESGELKAEVK